jgi:hypothetical protein
MKPNTERYSNTERIGVNVTENIVLNNIGWIFREQPIQDYGVDAQLEQVIDGNPTCKFIGVQIKTGKSHFHVSDKHLTYYASYIHYNYWLNSNIPIILVAHIPETNNTYWQHISEQNFQKAIKRWKLNIPLNQELNNKSTKRLNAILENSERITKNCLEFDNTQYDSQYLLESEEYAKEINATILKLGEKTNDYNKIFIEYNKIGISENDSRRKLSVIDLCKDLNNSSNDLESKIIQFSESYVQEIFDLNNAITENYFKTKDSKNITQAITSYDELSNAIISAKLCLIDLKEAIEHLPDKKIKQLKYPKLNLLNVFDLLINEFEVAANISGKLTELLKIIKQQ